MVGGVKSGWLMEREAAEMEEALLSAATVRKDTTSLYSSAKKRAHIQSMEYVYHLTSPLAELMEERNLIL
jgi:hypothetical protein